MGLLDLVTGGASSKANDALSNALGDISSVQSPTAAQLTLPELQQYVNAGLMTPAQAQAYLQQNNALATEDTSQTGTSAEIQALNQLAGVANAGPNGTPMEQAQQGQAIETMNQAEAGQRGAIEQAAEARGAPASMVQAALENQTVGQDAQQAHQDSLNAQANAYQAALQAMSGAGSLGGQLQGQQNTQANTVAQAQNAMQQFNAANQQNVSQSNAANQQQANAANAQTKQNTSNQNTETANQRTEYNTQLPQQVFNNNMQKANAEAGINTTMASNDMKQGQQNAGIFSGLLGAGATMGGNYLMGQGLADAMAPKTPGMAKGGIVGGHEYCYHDGGICMEGGGMVPGHAPVPGDSLKNDKVHAKLSPGEAVIPRTAVQSHMPEVLNLLSGHHQEPTPSIHPDDVSTVLNALNRMRHQPQM